MKLIPYDFLLEIRASDVRVVFLLLEKFTFLAFRKKVGLANLVLLGQNLDGNLPQVMLPMVTGLCQIK